MEFHEKLQALRKQKEITQEELAAKLFVSRTAVSKWESGRGYPNIESLKAIAKFYSVSIDELLSGEELLAAAEEEGRQKEKHLCDLLFGLLDCGCALLLFLPFYGQETGGILREVSLLSLMDVMPYMRIAYLAVVIGMIAWGIFALALQNFHHPIWEKNKRKGSLSLNSLGVLLFIVGQQPYAAVFLLVFLAIKAAMLWKRL